MLEDEKKGMWRENVKRGHAINTRGVEKLNVTEALHPGVPAADPGYCLPVIFQISQLQLSACGAMHGGLCIRKMVA